MTIVTDLSAAAMAASRLGFHCAPESRHGGVATANQLIVFEKDYWELLAILQPAEANAGLRRFQQLRSGVNGIACASADAVESVALANARGLPVTGPMPLERTVDIEGETAQLRFRIAYSPDTSADGLFLFYCEHRTPELIWRQPWRSHPNGALGIAKMTFVSEQPERLAECLARLFGTAAVASRGDVFRMRAGSHVITIRPASASTGGVSSAPSGRRRSPSVIVGIRVHSVQQAYRCAKDAGTTITISDRGEFLVMEPELGDLAIEYVTAANEPTHVPP